MFSSICSTLWSGRYSTKLGPRSVLPSIRPPATHLPTIRLLVLGLLAAGLMSRLQVALAADQPVPPLTPEQEQFFEQKIRPVLVNRCLECHGDKQQKGGVRLDSRAALYNTADTGPLVIPGKPEESRLIELLAHTGDIKMPPKEKLPQPEIDLLTDWVRRGAFFPASAAVADVPPASKEGIARARASHWAYQPLTLPSPPVVKQTSWPVTEVDQFVLARLEAAGLTPSPAADRPTLVRRLSFDLHGLPPQMDDPVVQQFLTSDRPEAWTALIDHYLASPAYGERWGRHWLDVARYSDTKGYVFTEERKYPFSYTYRDYVIDAFNRDLPYDQFIREQLAADRFLATGSAPATNTNGDNRSLAAMGFLTLGRRFSNNIHDIIDDRIDVVSRGLLGMTLTCARCHDHKYDPLATSDYYALYGVFSSSVEPGDLPQIGPADDRAAFDKFSAELQKREGELNTFVAEQSTLLQSRFREQAVDYLLAAGQRIGGPALSGTISTAKNSEEPRPRLVDRWVDYLRSRLKPDDPVFGPWEQLRLLPADKFTERSKAIYDELAQRPDTGDKNRLNRLVKEKLVETKPASLGDLIRVYGELLARVHQQWQEELKAGKNPPPTAISDPAAEELRQVLYADGSPAAIKAEEMRRLFDRAMRTKASDLQKQIDSLKANSPGAPPRAMVLNDSAQPGNARILIRGNPGRPGDEAPRRFLMVVAGDQPPVFTQGSGRKELAEAIASPTNPLTARVLVNRVWMQHFGTGIVRTTSDFGVRGDRPSHPELLDFLASRFIQNGWSIKQLHRMILTSQVYRQASQDRPDAQLIDPENRLLWKKNRLRLEFEPLRDSLLSVSGQLDRTIGGRPVDLMSQPFTTRRTVYGFIDRQDLPGLFRVFDFASPDVSTPQRPQTTVPQQALFLLNSPFVVEQARRLAGRPDVIGQADPAARIRTLYQAVFQRTPTAEELEAGLAFIAAAPNDSTENLPGWHYGWGRWDEKSQRVVDFRKYEHFIDNTWRGGPKLPDPQLSYLLLSSTGGHPGADQDHVTVRRWIAPETGRLAVTGVLKHAAAEGDGVRAQVVSSARGVVASGIAQHGQAEIRVDGIDVQAGDLIDLVVDCRSNQNHDGYFWSTEINLTVPASAAGDARTLSWNATSDFRGPGAPQLTIWEEYAQALLSTNEFVFID